MELEKKRAKSSPKKALQRYLFPITIISSILISGSVGYTASRMAVNNSASDGAEMHTMKNKMTEASNESIKVIETEIPKIISDLEKYKEDINLIDENIKWLKENLAPIREATSKYNYAITAITRVGSFVTVPGVSKMSEELAFAQDGINEIDSILLSMENLTVLQQEMSDSHQKLNLLYEEYKREKSIEQLLQIEQELNSNLIYQIEDLRNITMEAHEVFELSSKILITINSAKSIINSAQEKGETVLNAVQFWKNNEVDSEIEANLKEDLKKELEASKEKIQNLPNELAQRSKNNITSINNVQKELQTIKITQMVISE